MDSHPEETGACKCDSPKRLVLSFDGTDDKFSADESDTNIVKIYELLNRKSPDQYHYYQPGIGTYVPNELDNSSNGSWFGKIIDSAFGNFFVNHVIGGYQFLLRYYTPGDKIYIFGFSRGAYTARFLAEMIDCIGLLSKGNEEMISFAWDTFSTYQRNEPTKKARNSMDIFKSTFCRNSSKVDEKVVHFLGLFDCVNSVLAFSKRIPSPNYPIQYNLPAKYIRHAVSIHERRAMFQPTLFNPDLSPQSEEALLNAPPQLVQLWFAGNHGDVGGGWKMEKDGKYPFLLSDIPLMWMIKEVRAIDEASKKINDNNILQWDEDKNALLEVPKVRSGNWEAVVKHAELQIESWKSVKTKEELKSIRENIHDRLQLRTDEPDGTFGMVFFWWVLESLPIPRWAMAHPKGGKQPAIVDGKPPPKSWKLTWRPNLGSARSIPSGAKKHESVTVLAKCKGALDWVDNALEQFAEDSLEPAV